ncbi:MAG: non-ribosomal peptide synthetase, partial [Gammaproteobacteria bacterium]
YSDFAVWQRDWMRGNTLERELEHWKGQLAGAPELLELPTDRPRPTRQTFRGSRRTVALPAEVSRKLRDLSQQHGMTLFMTLLTAFKALLHRYTRQDDVVVGSPIAGRSRSETEGLIGFFVNTLALRTRVNPQMSFTELLAEVRKVTLAAYAHQELPFDKVVEYLHPQRSLSVTPFVQTMFVVQKGLSDDLRLPGITVTGMDVENGTSKFDLMLTVTDQEPQLGAAIEFNTDLYEAATIDRMLSHYATLLEAVVRNPAQRISELPLLSPAERDQLLLKWNETGAAFPRDVAVHRLFERQAQQTPPERAITDGTTHLTYEQLNERANRIARYLQRAGVVQGSFVGVYLERSAELIVTLLGILKAGGAYVPLDHSYPKDRLAFMLEDAQVEVLVTESRFASMLPQQVNTKCLRVDRDEEEIARESGQNLTTEDGGDSPAYVIYTSGSTGKPKGVVVPHRAINRLVINTNYVQLTPTDVMAQVSNSSFDAATWEIWGSLLNGGRLVIIPKDIV